jgi:four helix bundle protein
MLEVYMAVRNYRDLRVWQLAMDLVESVYKLTDKFPKHELYVLTAHVHRTAISVPSNIAEGHTKSHKKEYLQHLSTAQSSLSELETQIEIAKRLRYIAEDDLKTFLTSSGSLGKQLYALQNAIQKHTNEPYQPRNPKPET